MELPEGVEREQDDYLVKKNVLLRNYQLKLLEQAKKHNSIIYLPTGAGKTLIAIHVLCSRTQEIKRPFSDGGKRAFVVTTTKVMVGQMFEVMRNHTKFKVVGLNGDMNVDSWSGSKWKTLFEKYQVFVLTGEIFKVILHFNFIKPSQISLLVVDECHHAVNDHPYRLLLKAVTEADPDEAPLILGLSSILVNGSPKLAKVEPAIRALEACMSAKVITESQFQEVMSFSANPTDQLLTYQKDSACPMTDYISQTYDGIIDILDALVVKSPQDPVIPHPAKDFKNRNKASRLRKSFVLSKRHFEELGIFGGSLSALFFIIAFEKMRLLSVDAVEVQTLLYATTEMVKLRRALLNFMGEEESEKSILGFSSAKVRRLVQCLKEAQDASGGKHLSILIFVKERVTAIVLAFLLKRLKKSSTAFGFMNPEFIIGTSRYSKESVFLGCSNREIMRKFTSHSLNVLVATNLLEEGVDISACHVVISFDFPLGYQSYFQSRGRARDKESSYVMLAEAEDACKKRELLLSFKNIEKEVFRVVTQESSFIEGDECSSDVPEKIFLKGKSGVISLDGIIAIKAVERYCLKLPQDMYSCLSPISWYVRDGLQKKAFVRLPMNCPLRDVVEGEWRPSAKEAKKSCFLRTVKMLFDMGELDEEMNPKSAEVRLKDFDHLFPHYKDEKIAKSLPQPGTRRREQKYKMKFAESLGNSLPLPGVKAYLHVINFTLTFDKPPLKRKQVIYETLTHPATFALLSSKRLWKICQFPLFLDMGQINCDLLVNYDEVVFTETEMNDIKECHFALFKKVINVLKNSQVFDNRNKENSFFVVPMGKNEEGRYVVNWDVIRCDYCKNRTSALVRYNPSSGRGFKRTKDGPESTKTPDSSSNTLVPMNAISGRRLWAINEAETEAKFVMTETDYKYFVIVPNYRNQAYPQHYIVDKVCADMCPLTPFPNTNYADYVSYYKSNYAVDITNMTQPLLRVSPIFHCSNFNKPRGRKLKREKDKIHEEHLVPELCDVIPFDRNFFLKALLLPTALNRICHIYCVEEFRRKIASETGLGASELPEGAEWPPLTARGVDVNDETEEAPSFATLKDPIVRKRRRDENKMSALPLTKLKDQTQVKEQIIRDPERHMYDVGLCDLEFYVRGLKEWGAEEEEEEEKEMEELNENDEVIRLSARRNISVPPLGILKGGNRPTGPDLAQLIQASTSRSANDAVDYERLEILGDAFLKFATTLFLFKNINENEGVLTSLKGKIVGNRNLMYCALVKDFADVINVNDFVPSSDWNPPLFCIPERLVEGIISRDLDPAVIYRLDVPPEEQFSGVLSEDTFRKNDHILCGYDKSYEMATGSLLRYKIINDKTVSDCVEAFIGAYLLALGIRGAFRFISWLQLLPPSSSYSQLFDEPYRHPSHPPDHQAVITLLSHVFYSDLEDTLNYRFNNKAILLEAITHSSYSKNQVTDCYQRLELLGDAVLDFLVTTYVYEHCGDLGPGAVTDIRSSLVNNITFACLAVRYDLHKYLLSFSSSLSSAINNFVNFQASRNHVVDDNVLILLEENDYSMAESVPVPKALGDVFESLAGAIYLDSGNSLEAVWRVFYAMMKNEIDEFTKSVPKTPVRLLYEICGDRPDFECQVVESGLVMMSCVVYYEGEEIRAYGFGSNKKESKRSAVKVALNKILSLKK